jgi:UDP-glucose 4-epimerase
MEIRMKKILITGANSYIGTSFSNWMSFHNNYVIDTLDMISEEWKEKDFSQYDCIYHVAGIVHKKEKQCNIPLYYKVNRDLAIETALKAKSEGVHQFIILSSMSVYGVSTGVINRYTVPNPTNSYGKSKFQADIKILNLWDDNFIVTILRPPIIYGKGCKGNYVTLAKYALKLPIFPNIDNRRSMLYIDNLSEFVKRLIDKEMGGIFFPQNSEYVNITNLVRTISALHGHKIIFTKFFNPLIHILNYGILKKIFGDLIYDEADLCDYVKFVDTIIKTEL